MRTATQPKLNLEKNPGSTPVWVSMESFFDFSFSLAEELEDLVARHRQVEAKRNQMPKSPVPAKTSLGLNSFSHHNKPSPK